jgi:hypothetical protein
MPIELLKKEFINEYNRLLEYNDKDDNLNHEYSFKDTFYEDLDNLVNKLTFNKDSSSIIISFSHVINFKKYRLVLSVSFIFKCKTNEFILQFNYNTYDIVNNEYFNEDDKIITLLNNTINFSELVNAFIDGVLYVGDVTWEMWTTKYKKPNMLKNIKEFYKFNKLDMSVNPNFISYENYKNYLDDVEVYDLVNALNNLYWEMESDVIDDETANEYTEEIEKLENEIYETIKNLRINNRISEFEQVNDTIINDFKYNLEDVISDYSIESTSTENGDVVILVNINNEEYEIHIDSNDNAFLYDADYVIPIGNIYEYNVGKTLKNIINLYGEEYINYLKNNSIK